MCNKECPIELFVKNNSSTDGYNYKCCVCTAQLKNPNIDEKEVITRRLRKLEKFDLEKEDKRRCGKCDEIKSIDDFFSGTSSRWKSQCKICANKISKSIRQKPQNWIKYRETKRQKRNSDEFSKWVHHSIRSHIKRGFVIQIDEDVLINSLRNNNCFYCQHKVRAGYNATIDVIDGKVIKVGSFVVCCKPCNSTKATKSADEYKQLLKSCPKLLTALEEENSKFLKQFYAMFVPLSKLIEIANEYQFSVF